jgi:aspartate racemase
MKADVKMKTCGLLGGISWTSSDYYYKMLNIGISKRLGGLYSSRSIMFSLNLQEYSDLAYYEDKSGFKDLISDAALSVFKAGADFLVICSNTAHMALDEIESKCKENKIEKFVKKEESILHITDCTAYVIKNRFPQVKRIGLIGTIFTMKSNHIVDRLILHGFSVVVPEDEKDQRTIMDIIETELTQEIFDNPKSIQTILNIIYQLKKDKYIEGVVLGCTELPLLIKERVLMNNLYVFDPTEMHIECAIKVQLNESDIKDFLP